MESLPAESQPDDGGTIPPSSPCPKCGIRPRALAGGTRGYCRQCNRDRLRSRRAVVQTAPPKPCPTCGKSLPHKSKGCPVRQRLYFIQRGRQNLNDRWPGYGSFVSDETFLFRAGKNWPHVAFPLPSHLFVGLDAALDARLKREHHDKDVVLCRSLAALPTGDQREFLDLYLSDPADAHHWAALPKWKRPLRKGDKDDIQIWKFFTMQRLNMEQAARDAPPWSMDSQGAQLPQMFGVLRTLSLDGLRKLVAVMSTFGVMLQEHRDIGDTVTKPWVDGVANGFQTGK